MMHITYKLDRSDKHGIGLFSDQDVEKGSVIYTASPLLDLNLTQEQFQTLSAAEQGEVRWWGFWDDSLQVWHVDFDVSKFINHASDATVTQEKEQEDAYLVAVRDLKKGEELTQDYREFESEADLSERGITL